MKNLLTFFALAFLCVSLSGQPNYFNYQGVLKDVDGLPLENGGYTLEFNIYDAATDGNLIWGPFINDGTLEVGHAPQAQLIDGQFNVIIGPTDTSGRSLVEAFENGTTFIEVSVNEGAPISPRQQILSAPYALFSKTAATLVGELPAQYRNPPGTMVMFAGTADKVPDGWLLCDGSEYDVTLHPELYAAIGDIWGSRQTVEGEVVTNFFSVPDMRGMFPRGANLGRTDGYKDPDAGGRANAQGVTTEDAGTLQTDRLAEHKHIWAATSGGSNYVDSWTSSGAQYRWLNRSGEFQIHEDFGSPDFTDNFNDIIGTQSLYTKPGSTQNDTVDPIETRPNNAAVNYIIKL